MENNELLHMITGGGISKLLNGLDNESANLIYRKLNEIPDSFFEARYSNPDTPERGISLIDFAMQTSGMSGAQLNGYMARYGISHSDFAKLQNILNSIQVAAEYGKGKNDEHEEEKTYGIALSSGESLDKAYPLWLAYLYADVVDKRTAITNRLIADGKIGKYSPEYIMGLIERGDKVMDGKTEEEKQNSYLTAITKVLDDGFTMPAHEEIETEVDR